ncbi:translation initiation factor IF-3 [Colletotrichum truncatum]|uniref:Translation initiation factor IF-3 n=1 Tax=Colletotrichum truncatum TaxID=5467 RepID=A0ACC3ZII8_COLTU|nr:translation initiation factor IF-3 [Colletotrichum truncatum]KAF6786741.1 translation initiation factor IF-3 [Colletotrichum truncatum]
MRVTRCLFNSRTALHRVFVSPYEKVEVLSRRSALSICSARVLPPVLAPIPNLTRHASLVSRFKKRNVSPAASNQKKGPPADEEIRDRMIMVVDENNKLEGPYETKKVLASLDPEAQSLRMVSRPPPNPTEDQPRFAICKIINKREEKAKERALEKVKKEAARKLSKVKELELNWAIAPHDLSHKMKQMKTFLEKGYKVEVLFAKKKGSRIATRDEAEALVQSVRESMAEIQGAKEWKEPDGAPLKVMKLYLNAPSNAS